MKRIAITQRVERWEEIGERRDALSQEWADLAAVCGFLPVLVPNRPTLVEGLVRELEVEGVLLTGGNDLACCGGDAPERDLVEERLIGYAVERRLPLLGVCRGMQMLLTYFGGTLQPVQGHVKRDHRLSNGDRVNSFHTWGAMTCPPPLEVLAVSGDGVVEAVAHKNYPYLYGIMWHPERYHPFRAADQLLIRSIFQR